MIYRLCVASATPLRSKMGRVGNLDPGLQGCAIQGWNEPDSLVRPLIRPAHVRHPFRVAEKWEEEQEKTGRSSART